MPSMCSKTPRSADAILASYLEQQERQLSKSSDSSKRNTNSKVAYKLSSGQQLDCRHLINSPTSEAARQQRAGAFFPHHLHDNALNGSRERESGELEMSATSLMHIKRKLVAFLTIYALIIISLYLTYAVYCYYQQNQFKRQQVELQHSLSAAGQQQVISSASPTPSASAIAASSDSQHEQLLQELQTKLESKIQLLERYIEVLALDLEGTKTRLSEREKCACSIGCSFNGTKYADQQSWSQKCDVCKCQSGKISCQPRECPKLKCQNDPQAVIQTLPGQCCPSCMLKCKVNKTLVRHGHSFRPLDSSGQQTKECKCANGLIKCQPLRAPIRLNPQTAPKSANKTIEYLRSILGSKFVIDAASLDKPTPAGS